MVKDGIFLGKRYEVLSKIGAGGMADVYKGKDCMLNRYVAIKVLKKEYREDENFVKKFRSEAQAAAGLLNPNIVNVYDVGEDRGLYYMVMELVEGITLKEYIQKKRRLSTREVLSISIQMCTGIEAAHKHNIIHRDIKPQNIIISKEGKVKVTDFGIAKATTSNTVSSNAMGSVHYVSPEQARGGFCDAKSDIYSVGITMFEMVTGQVPFDGDSTVSVAMKHLQENITPPSELAPDISPALEKIILKCTQKSAERRYQDTNELIQDLKRALVDPDGNFVRMVPIRSVGDTVMISSEDMGRIKHGRGREYDDGYEDDYEDDYDDDGYEDDDYDDDYDDDDYDDRDYDKKRRKGEGDVDPRMNKMMKILTIVVVVIIVFVLIFIIGKAAGVFRFGEPKSTEQQEEKVEVPALLGETEEVAAEMCRKKGITLKVVSQKQSDDYKEGQIMEQNPTAGTKVDKKTEIEVVICSGAEEKKVPDVSGEDESEAQRILKKEGFEKTDMQSEYSDTVPEGQVIETNPKAGETVTVDTEIVIIVSKGAEKKTVPNLKGKTKAQAQSELTAAGLKDGGGTEEYSNTVEAGKIISQSVDAGKKVNAGTSVSYVVSKGKEPAEKVNIPSGLSGKGEAEVKQILRNIGLKYGAVQYKDSPSPYGTVLWTDPEEGTSVEVGSTVTIYASNGSMSGSGSEDNPTDPGNGGDSGNSGGTGTNP